MNTRDIITVVIDDMRPCENAISLTTVTNVLENFIDFMKNAHTEKSCMEYYYNAKGTLAVLWKSKYCKESQYKIISGAIEILYNERMEFLQRVD